MQKILYILFFCFSLSLFSQTDGRTMTSSNLNTNISAPIGTLCPFGQSRWYQDSDLDTYGNPDVSMCASSMPDGYVANNLDCDDSDADATVLAWYYPDNDGDGFGALLGVKTCSPDPNYTTITGDCDDNDPSVTNTGAIWYQDTDNDGFGDPSVTTSTTTCTAPSGYVANNNDNCPTDYGLDNGCPVGGVYENMNWIISKTYDIQGGLTSSGKAYFDELGKGIQSQTVDIKTGKTWATQTMYDVQGRAALQTLSSPVDIAIGSFLYQTSFIKKANGSPFLDTDFETDIENPSLVGDQANSLGWYYSENNDSEPYQDVTDYPFSRTIYSELNPGAALKTIGGNKVDHDNDGDEEWISGFSYTMPAAQEMHYAFGKGYFGEEGVLEENEEVVTKFFKSVSIDVHDVESVVFTDGEGKTLAAARSGGSVKYDVISPIGDQGYIDVHIPIGIVNSDLQLLGDPSFFNNYRIFNLRTEELVSFSQMTGGNFYRIEYLGDIEEQSVYINNSGIISFSTNQTSLKPKIRGLYYKVNYYDYTLNYYDKVGRLLKTTQPLGFNEEAFDLTVENPDHQLASTYTYNALNQLIETTSPDEGTANFIYREDGQIRFSQNTKQNTANEFSYTNYDELARPTESGVYFGETSFDSTSMIDYNLTDITNVSKQGQTIKKEPINLWNSGVATLNALTGDGHISWQFSGTDIKGFVGLSTNNANVYFSSIQFGIYVENNMAYIIESGSNKGALGAFTTNDQFKIERIGSTIYYKKNNVAHAYTSTSSASLIGDISLFSSDIKILDFNMEGNQDSPSSSFSILTNTTANGNDVSKTTGVNLTWDASFRTSQTLSDNGSISWTTDQNNKTMMVGLTSLTNVTHPSYAYIENAIYLHSNGNFYIYEIGVFKGHYGAYVSGDNFKVERNGSTITYLKNGTVFYTSTTPYFNEDLVGAASFYHSNGSISNVNITGGNGMFKDFSGVATHGNQISKIGRYAWDSGFSSDASIDGDGLVQFETPTNSEHFMLGLSETNVNASFQTIQFAIYLNRNGRVYVRESGANVLIPKTSYQAGDTFKVVRSGTAGTISYYKNDILLHTSIATSTAPLYLDASLSDPYTSVSNVTLNTLNNNSSSVVNASTVLDTNFCKERHLTVYDEPDLNGLYEALDNADLDSSYYPKQNFVAGNVSKTYTVNPNTTTTWYSYDIYGRVEWVVQYIDGLGLKTIDYEYDPVKGQVTKVIYQKHNNSDMFVHAYNYNQVGQLESVQTSTDNIVFIEQAEYIYYETGALKRTVLRGGIQGTDYVYNLAGQLKAINHPTLKSYSDPGGDTNDAFGMHIDYYKGDYARITPTQITSSINGENRYDGNIKATRWGTRGLDLNPEVTHNAYMYNYNNNKWLTDATYGTVNETGLITPDINNQYLVSNLTYDANGNLLSLDRNKNGGNGNVVNMDQFTYNYNPATNQLNHVTDAVTASNVSEDLNSQNPDNYVYNSIGQLIEEDQEGHQIKYSYNASGLVTGIIKNGTPYLNFYYNDKGHRVRKEVTENEGESWQQTFYVRDVSGSVMAIYNGAYGSNTQDPNPEEYPIYGASRLGVFNKPYGKTNYQLTDHLGNVRAVITEGSQSSSYTDYYPGGMAMPGRNVVGDYRYTYQGQEKDPETGKEAFELRLYDARINRWIAPDPYGEFFSPYLAMGNNWINRIDPTGGMTDCPDCPDPPIGTILLDEVIITASKGSTWLNGAVPSAIGLEHASFVRNNFYVPNDRALFQGFKNGELSQFEYVKARYELQGAARSRMTRTGQAASELAKTRAAQRQTFNDFATGKKDVRVAGKGNTNTRNFGGKGTLIKGASRALIVYGVYNTVEHIHSAEDKGLAISQEAGGWAGAWGGAKAGGALGSFFGPVGTIVGGVVGGAVGYAAGYAAGGAAYREFD